jgi:tetratricopeptide (TPR) repeat protein
LTSTETHRGASRNFPTPPAPYIAHPYTLRQQFFGRVSELAELDAWARDPDARVMLVEAVGGIGKSALTWEWVEQRATEAIPNLSGVIWWSFYDSDGTLPALVPYALAYLTGTPLDELRQADFPDQVEQLLSILSSRPVLLVFDGFERALAAYHQMEAPRLNDEMIQTADDARRLTDPSHGALLLKLLDCSPSKILISTRLVPRDLESKPGMLRPGVHHRPLNGLTDVDTLALLRHLDIRGDEAEILDYTRRFDNHSLLIAVLAGMIHADPDAQGDFGAWRRGAGAALTLQPGDLSGNRTTLLQVALAMLPTVERTLLGRMAAFRYPVDHAALRAINPVVPTKPEIVRPPNPKRLEGYRRLLANKPDDEYRQNRLKEVQAEHVAGEAAYQNYLATVEAYLASDDYQASVGRLDVALRELERRGLMQHSGGSYDLHPVVRASAFDLLQGWDRKDAFGEIRDHFSEIPPENLDEVTEIHQLRRTLEIYHALVGAGLRDQASDFYEERLTRTLQYHLAAYLLIIELLTPLFPDGLDALPALSMPDQQVGRLTDLAGAFYQLDQSQRAATLETLCMRINLDQKNEYSLERALENYSLMLRHDRKYATTARVLPLVMELAQATWESNRVSMVHLRHLSFYNEIGAWQEMETHYRLFNANLPKYETEFWASGAERAYAEMLLSRHTEYDGATIQAAIDRAWEMSVNARCAVNMRGLLFLRGEYALIQGRPADAIVPFQELVTQTRKSGIPTAGANGNLARAYARLGKHDEALTLIAEGIESSDAADVYLTLGNHEQAREHALIAYAEAWADGEPYSDWRTLHKMRAILAALDIPEPALPRRAPDPIPYEDEIRALIEELNAEHAAKSAEETT